MSKLTRLVSATILGSVMAMSATVPLFAATQQPATGGGNAIRIAPVRTDLTIDPGTSQSVSVSVQNLTSQTATFQAVINDFQAGNNENGQPSLLLDNEQSKDGHSLKQYVNPIPNVTLAANETKQVRVTVTIPKDAAAGGHYGAVRFAPTNQTAPGQTGATLSASVGSLILVRVPGDIKDDLRVASFDVRTSADANTGSSFFTTNKNLNAVVRFKNQGNVQEQPFGKVLLKKGGKILQTTEINNAEPKGNVLPSSVRRFSVPLKGLSQFGKYTVEGNFGYGNTGQLLSAKATFYVVPVVLIVITIVLLVLIIAAIIVVPRSIKRYNQRILRRAGRR